MIIFIYSELLYHVLACISNKNFMHQPLVALLRMSKEKCDEYTVLFIFNFALFQVLICFFFN